MHRKAASHVDHEMGRESFLFAHWMDVCKKVRRSECKSDILTSWCVSNRVAQLLLPEFTNAKQSGPIISSNLIRASLISGLWNVIKFIMTSADRSISYDLEHGDERKWFYSFVSNIFYNFLYVYILLYMLIYINIYMYKKNFNFLGWKDIV